MEDTARQLAEQSYRDYAKIIYRFCLFRTNSYHDAEDMTTEVFAKVLSGKADRIPEDKLIGWLIKVADNECKMLFRKAGARRERFTDSTVNETAAQSSSHDHPWLSLEIFQAVNRLKNISKKVFFLKAVEGHTFKEIAAALGIGEGAVKMTFYRSVKYLKKQLSEEV